MSLISISDKSITFVINEIWRHNIESFRFLLIEKNKQNKIWKPETVRATELYTGDVTLRSESSSFYLTVFKLTYVNVLSKQEGKFHFRRQRTAEKILQRSDKITVVKVVTLLSDHSVVCGAFMSLFGVSSAHLESWWMTHNLGHLIQKVLFECQSTSVGGLWPLWLRLKNDKPSLCSYHYVHFNYSGCFLADLRSCRKYKKLQTDTEIDETRSYTKKANWHIDYKIPSVIHPCGGFLFSGSPLLLCIFVSLQRRNSSACCRRLCRLSLSISGARRLQSKENWALCSLLLRTLSQPSPLSHLASFVWLCCSSAEQNVSRAATLSFVLVNTLGVWFLQLFFDFLHSDGFSSLCEVWCREKVSLFPILQQ